MKMLSWFFGVLLLAWPAYAQVPSVFIDDLTWPEVRDAIAGGKRTAIVYVGSSERNGPHMVIGKHNFVARALAQRIAEELGNALAWISTERNWPNIRIAKGFAGLRNFPPVVGQISAPIERSA